MDFRETARGKGQRDPREAEMTAIFMGLSAIFGIAAAAFLHRRHRRILVVRRRLYA